MIENQRDTNNLGYLGRPFQYKVLLELLTDTKFGENILSYLQSKYFDDDTFKRILIETKNYQETFGKIPSIRNHSIIEHVRSRISNEIELKTILAILDKIKKRDKERNSAENRIPDDSEAVQMTIWNFIKQQEYKNLGQFIIKSTVDGDINIVNDIEDKINNISKIGPQDDMAIDVFSDIDDTLSPDYRNTIPTGLGQDIDDLMGGGLGNGEMGFVLAPLGTGKAQPLTSKVLTPNGWKLMGDIQVGDEVISSNGKPTKVLGVFPQEGDRDVYKIEMNDGSITECDIDHLWSVKLGNNNEFEVKELSYLIEEFNNGNTINLPITKPIYFNKIKTPKIDTIRKYSMIDRPHDLGRSLYAYNNNLIDQYIEHIIYNDIDYRIEFLKGYFQSKINKKPIIDNLISIKEADIYYLRKLYEIIKTLGGVGEFSICQEYKWPNLKFTLPKDILNKIFEDDCNLDNINLFIKNIEYKGKEKTQCIYIEDESHEYITDDYIVTHNTTILTKIANNAHSLGKHVLHIFFEDNKKQIKRKHFSIWSGVPQSKIDDETDVVRKLVSEKKEALKRNKLVLVKFPQDDNITIPYIKRWIVNYQKLHNIKFEMIVLDYIDCVESHDKNKNSDILSNELKVVKAYEAMLAEFNVPGWSAIQGNRNSIGAEIVTTNQMGGSIKKAQKTHFLLSIARSDEQKDLNLANIKILKSRFGKDGITFEDCIFNNDSLNIVIKKNKESYNVIDNNLRDLQEDPYHQERRMAALNEL